MIPSTKLGGLWRVYPENRDTHHGRVRCTDRNRRSSDTELPRLTSDPIVYGGPQGWNPHFLRTRRLPREGIKPFEPRSNAAERRGIRIRDDGTSRTSHQSRRALFAFVPNALIHLRASDWIGAGYRIQRTLSRYGEMGRQYLNASNRDDADRRPITQSTFLRAGSRPEGARRHRVAPFTLHRNRVIYLRPSNCFHTASRYHATIFHRYDVKLRIIARLEANRSSLATGVVGRVGWWPRT